MSFAHAFLSTPAAPARPAGSDAWLRTLVADHLGVAESDLVAAVSLTDDLAVDSLDFADLAAAMEGELGIVVPTSLLRHVRTYADLRDLADELVREQARRAREGVALLRARLWTPALEAAAVLERVFALDPYALEILLDDASHAGSGTQLDVVVDPSTPPGIVARVRGRLARLERRGVAVRVRRDRRAA
jgi:acyl carrier protein